MIESYAFLVMFTLQILAMSVLHPALLIRYTRVKVAEYPRERFPQLYAGGLFSNMSTELFLSLYRALNTLVAVLGLLLLAWLFNYMQRPDWEMVPVVVRVVVFFVIQFLPLVLLVVISFKQIMVLRSVSVEGKRKAVLQRRGLFDFVSPYLVFIAVVTGLLFVAFMIYVIHFREKPFPAVAGYLVLGVVVLSYVLSGIWTYKTLYGRKLNPFESHADRMHTIGLGVKSTIYTAIASDVYLPIFLTLQLLDLQRWMPLAQSAFLVVFVVLICGPFIAPPPQPEVDRLGESPAK
jgi:hypothetical protein